MATWDKDTVFIELVTPVTGAVDETAYTVKFQPVSQTYPTGAITGTQCTSRPDRWYPASDLDDEEDYDVYLNTVKKKRIFSPISVPPKL